MKKMSFLKYPHALAGLVLCLFSGVTPASIILTPQASIQSLAVGEITTVSISISGLGINSAPSLGTFDIDLIFDPAVLSFVDLQFGGSAPLGDQLDLTAQGSLNGSSNPSPGLVNLYEVSLDSEQTLNSQQADSFVLATLQFMGVTFGTSQISIVQNALGDAAGGSLSANVQATSVTVASVPLPGSLMLLLSGQAVFGLLGLRARKRIPAQDVEA